MPSIPPGRHLAYLTPGRRRQLPSCLNFCAARTVGRFSLHGPISISMVLMFLAPLLQRSDPRIFAVAAGGELPKPDPGNPFAKNTDPSRLQIVEQWKVAAGGEHPKPDPGNPFAKITDTGRLQIEQWEECEEGGGVAYPNPPDLKFSSWKGVAATDEQDSSDLMLASRLFERPATRSVFVELTCRLGPVLLKRLEQLSALNAAASSQVGLEIADSLYILKLLRYSHPQLEIVREKALKGALLLQQGEAIVRDVQNLIRSAI